MSANAFSEWTKLFGDFKTPAVDVNQIIAQYRRNAETGSTVIQIFTESAQAIGRRQAEIARANAEQLLKASKDSMSQSSPENAASKQADFAKNMMDFNINGAREIAEMSTKAAQEVVDVVNKRFAEVFSEATACATSAKKKAA